MNDNEPLQNIEYNWNDKLNENLKEIYEKIKKEDSSGKLASYIPELAKVNPDMLGISFCDIDGHMINIGNHDELFCLQSCSKVLTYLLASNIHDSEYVHKHVGHEPSGRSFNDFVFNDDGLPFNPMINAGAIMIVSLIINDRRSMSVVFNEIKNFMNDMAGHIGILGYDNSVYLSERETASKNKALANMMLSYDAFPKDKNIDIDLILDLYYQICSMTSNTNTLSKMMATLANGGMCPINGKQVIQPSLVQKCLVLMSTCGLYDASGLYSFEVGIPSKSGVSGCIIAVIPGVGGLSVWSPPLDKKGNSVKGVKIIKELSLKYPNWKLYNVKIHKTSIDDKGDKQTLIQKLIYASSEGDNKSIEKLIKKIDINSHDYDLRTPIHLSCAEGHIETVKFLIKHNANINVSDRYGNTPLSEVNNRLDEIDENESESDNNNYKQISELLKSKLNEQK